MNAIPSPISAASTISAASPPHVNAALAFVAGFVDTCGFVALFGLFSAHVTGNFVLLGASLAHARPGVLGKLLALPIFVLAVAATRLYLLRRGQGGTVARELLLAQLVFLGAFLAVGLLATPVVADAPLAILAGLFAVVAMGIQNATARTLYATASPSTVMTGNVTQAVLDGVDCLVMPPGEARRAALIRIRKFGPPIIAFALGAAGGGLGFGLAGFWCILVPMTVIAALLPRSSRS